MEENTSQKKNKQGENSIGPIIGTLIIVIVLIAAALYVWGEHLNTAAQIQEEESRVGTTTTIIYSTSTEPIDIQNDLKASSKIQNPGF